MQVLFANTQGEIREIGSFDSTGLTGHQIYTRALKFIRDFCKDRNFHTFYTRYWTQDGKTIVDVGSHSEFFHIVPALDFETQENII
jgi:tricorn protease-like protein